MKILLIGKNGQLGKEIINSLPKEFEIYPFSREELDVTNTDQLVSTIRKISPDFVINTSAFQIVDECETNPTLAFAINTLAVKNIAILCNKLDIKLVTISTDYVFDGRKNSPYSETDCPNPLQIYGLTKYAGEIAGLNYNPNSYIVRTCALYGGETGSRTKGNFIINILKEAENKESIEVNNDQIISPTYAVDMAKAMWKLIEKKSPYGIYHLVNEGSCSWADLATEVMMLKKRTTKIIPVMREGKYGNISRPLFTALSNTKAKSLGIFLPEWHTSLSIYIDRYLYEK